MKIVIGLMMFVLLGINIEAQTPRVVAELAASSDKTIKNSPFSAEAVSESVQVLADGNRIVRSSTSKLYRNGEGRFRRELTSGTGGAFGSLFTTGPGITILDPVAGQRYLLNSELRTARIAQLEPGKAITVTGSVSMDPARLAELKKLAETQRLEGKLTTEARVALAPLPPMPPMAVTGAFPAMPGMPHVPFGAMGHSNYESRTEELGSRDFEGVTAEGKRTVTTIPADAIGNERPIEISYERWYSKELELVVYSKHSDPRFGDQTYKLTNLVRSEPDPSLFTLPQGYRLMTAPDAVYKFKSAEDAYRKSAEEYHKVTLAKPATATAPAAVFKLQWLRTRGAAVPERVST
jgi:hypothetical protein